MALRICTRRHAASDQIDQAPRRPPSNVCPASYDLGEDLRLVLLSVTEGEDKPLKYPTIFNSADAGVITKIDLAAAVEFDELAANANIQAVRPGMRVFKVSAKTDEGMDDCLQFLKEMAAKRLQQTPV